MSNKSIYAFPLKTCKENYCKCTVDIWHWFSDLISSQFDTSLCMPWKWVPRLCMIVTSFVLNPVLPSASVLNYQGGSNYHGACLPLYCYHHMENCLHYGMDHPYKKANKTSEIEGINNKIDTKFLIKMPFMMQLSNKFAFTITANFWKQQTNT